MDARFLRQKVAEQYETYPYPQIPLLTKISTAAAHTLAYELGQSLRTGFFQEHTKATRILVAGCGTLEPLVVARAHPLAEIVAVDASAASLKILRRRAWLAGLSPRIHCVQRDLHEHWPESAGSFDYIVCTGVLHHSPTPELLLERLAVMLKPTGVLRLMMYPARSRMWIYELQKFFAQKGIQPSGAFRERCFAAIDPLSATDPLRLAFETYTDAESKAGLVDGFFHACDRPIPIPRFQKMASRLGLALLGFGHARHSQPAIFEQSLEQVIRHFAHDRATTAAIGNALTQFRKLNAWQRLTLLDDLHELSINPVFWLSPRMEPVQTKLPAQTRPNPVLVRWASNPLHALFPRPIAAPLMPTQGDETVAVQRFGKELPANESYEYWRWCVGGWLLADDGSLPQALAVNRCKLGAAAAGASDSADVEEGLSPQQKMRAGLARALLALKAKPELLLALAKVLEPRVDAQGRELPGLTSGDLLRALFSEGKSCTQIYRELVGSEESVAAKAPALGVEVSRPGL